MLGSSYLWKISKSIWAYVSQTTASPRISIASSGARSLPSTQLCVGTTRFEVQRAVTQTRDDRPVVNKPPPLNRDCNRDPSIKALKRRGFINRGSTLQGS